MPIVILWNHTCIILDINSNCKFDRRISGDKKFRHANEDDTFPSRIIKKKNVDQILYGYPSTP